MNRASASSLAAAGFGEIYVHQIGPEQEGFLRFYAEDVLPSLNRNVIGAVLAKAFGQGQDDRP